MAYSNGLDRYKKTDVNTATPGTLVVMLYEGAIRFLEAALKDIDDKTKLESVHTNLVKAQDIVTELLVSLNYEAGDIANRLASIYSYINRRLIEANVQKARAPIDEVLKYLYELKDAWEKAVEQTGGIGIVKNDAPKTPEDADGAAPGGRVNVSG